MQCPAVPGHGTYWKMPSTIHRTVKLHLGKCLSLAMLLAHPIHAQTIPYSPGGFPDRGVFRQRSAPEDAMELKSANGGRTGKVWVQQQKDGIIVFGRIDGKAPNWARFPMEMGSRDHVSLWLAAAERVEMPEIGWGSQFGYTNCEEYSAESSPRMDDEDCTTWSARQQTYRNHLRSLFVRHWRLSPRVSSEEFATEAHREVLRFADDTRRLRFDGLEPVGRPWLESSNSTGYSLFQIYVRWSDFPPASSLRLDRIHLALEFFDQDGGYSTITPSREGGDPATFTKLELQRPIEFRLTQCNGALQGADPFGRMSPAWYYPGAEELVSEVFILANDAAGYRYGPEGLSPVPSWTHHFSKELDAGAFICGPILRYSSDEATFESAYTVEEQHLSHRRLREGSYLLKSGPRLGVATRFGAGQCGSCTAVRMEILFIDQRRGISLPLRIRIVIDAPRVVDADIQIAPDWMTVMAYSASAGAEDEKVWSLKKYCFSDGKYEECGSGPSDPPPLPRLVDFPRWDQ